jgi:GT2 family glycosyltransferase
VSRPLVSILTPTWQRHDLLLETIENVRQQTYRPLEMVIVSDGPDPALMALILRNVKENLEPENRALGVRPLACGRHWTGLLSDSFAAAPLLVASLVAAGEYQTWLADDERMAPDHVEALVDLLERSESDFVYGRVEMYWKDRPTERWTIGTDPARYGQVTNVLHRADILRRGLYRFGEGMQSDWATISQWIDAGARYAMLDRVTLTHRADHGMPGL